MSYDQLLYALNSVAESLNIMHKKVCKVRQEN